MTGKFAGQIGLQELVPLLLTQAKKVQSGDMRLVESMLSGQAMTLQTIFTELARLASSQEYMNQFQAYLGLALKAQSKCRTTLEALAEIKNPRPVAFVKQANISGGPQQVNNGMQPAHQAGPARGGEGIESLPDNPGFAGVEQDAQARTEQNPEPVKRNIEGASHGFELDIRA